MTNTQLTYNARAIAHRMTYNGDQAQAAAKHMLLALAHRLDTQDVRAHRKSDGLLLTNGLGKSRYATLRERLLHWAFGVIPARV